MNNNKQVMQLMYDEAKIYLKEICPDNIDLDKYFNLKKTFKTKNDILFTLLVCLQDRQMADKVIGFMKSDRQEIFKELLFDYDSDKILSTYDSNTLLNEFSKQLDCVECIDVDVDYFFFFLLL